MKVAVTQLSSFSAAGFRFRAASSIARASLVLDLDSVPNNYAISGRERRVYNFCNRGAGFDYEGIKVERVLSAVGRFLASLSRTFGRKRREELPQRSQRKPRCYADAPFTSTPAHFSSRVSVAA